MAPSWLLGIGALLSLGLGDALICSECYLTEPGENCEKTCYIDNAETGCMVVNVFEGGALLARKETCYYPHPSTKCGTSQTRYGVTYEFSCCDNFDLCNHKP